MLSVDSFVIQEFIMLFLNCYVLSDTKDKNKKIRRLESCNEFDGWTGWWKRLGWDRVMPQSKKLSQ